MILRASTLLVLVAALVLAWRACGPAPAREEGLTRGGSAAEGPATGRASLEDVGTGLRRDAGDAALAQWRVRAMAGERALDGARLRATRGPEVREAEGDARWTDLPAGTWTLVVEAAGYAARRLDVVLVAGLEVETVVDLAATAVLRGRVRDHYGDPRRSHFVGLVPEGRTTPPSPRDWLSLPHARTDRRGEFAELTAPAGRYRLFVGYQGRITFEDDEVVALGAADAAAVDVVMRAPPRLLVEVYEAPSVTASTAPYGVSVYRDAAILDVERPLPPQVAPAPPPDPDDPTLDIDDETREELRIAVEDEKRELTPEERAAHERRLQVVPSGWRVDRSAICDAEGRLLLEFLPVGEELRFAVSRSGEALRVDSSAWLDGVVPTRVRIELPPPLAPDAELGDEPRTARALATPVTLPREPLEIGAEWTLPPR